MNNYRKGVYAAMFSALLAGSIAPAFAGNGDVATQPETARAEPAVAAASTFQETQTSRAVRSVVLTQPLNDVVVTSHSNPLLRSDQRLAMLNASLPLDAKGGAPQASDLERVAALFPDSPDTAVGEARRMMERGQTPPDGSDPDGNIALGGR